MKTHQILSVGAAREKKPLVTESPPSHSLEMVWDNRAVTSTNRDEQRLGQADWLKAERELAIVGGCGHLVTYLVTSVNCREVKSNTEPNKMN